MAEVSVPSARTVNAQRLTVLLKEAGWRLVGGRRGIYNRLAPPGSEPDLSGSLVVPLDSSAPEYYELMHAALSLLSSPQYYDLWQRDISPRLSAESTDEFRFRKDSAAPSGLISWKQGEGLIESARATLVAGAKSFMEPGRRYYNNRHGQFANRYLDTVLMGQTAAGSYVITAYAPANISVPLKGSQSQVLGLEGVDLTPARQVSTAIIKAVEATVEALEHHRATGSLSGLKLALSLGSPMRWLLLSGASQGTPTKPKYRLNGIRPSQLTMDRQNFFGSGVATQPCWRRLVADSPRRSLKST